MTFSPGRCYEVTFNDGETVTFRYLGPTSGGMQEIEVPPDSGDSDTFERLVPGAYRQVVEVEWSSDD